MLRLEPKEIQIDGKKFILHKFPAIQGREIICTYPASAVSAMLPKVGEYKHHEEAMFKLLSYVGVPIEGRPEPLMLSIPELINQHTGNWNTLMKLEKEMLEYNGAFFVLGQISNFWRDLSQKLRQSSSKTLIHFLELFSKKIKQHFANSKQSTR